MSSWARAAAEPGLPRRLSSAVPTSAMAWPTTKMFRALIMSAARGSAKPASLRTRRPRSTAFSV